MCGDAQASLLFMAKRRLADGPDTHLRPGLTNAQSCLGGINVTSEERRKISGQCHSDPVTIPLVTCAFAECPVTCAMTELV